MCQETARNTGEFSFEKRSSDISQASVSTGASGVVQGDHEDITAAGVIDIGPYDVLCGRHKASHNNVGNRRFRVTILLAQERYLKAPSRKDRSVVIKSVASLVMNNGGRFLQRKKGQWVELNEKQTQEKVGHALRDMAVHREEKAERKSAVAAARSSSVAADASDDYEYTTDEAPVVAPTTPPPAAPVRVAPTQDSSYPVLNTPVIDIPTEIDPPTNVDAFPVVAVDDFSAQAVTAVVETGQFQNNRLLDDEHHRDLYPLSTSPSSLTERQEEKEASAAPEVLPEDDDDDDDEDCPVIMKDDTMLSWLMDESGSILDRFLETL